MIRHIVMFSAASPENADVILETLRGYAAIPGVLTIEVERNLRLDSASREIDIVLYAEFADEDALSAYKAHPVYRAGTRTVRPLRTLRYVGDLKVD